MTKKTALIVYPQKYVIAEGEKTGNGYDYVLGVDDEGNKVKVTLQYSREEIEKTYQDKSITHTTIEMLADTGRRAQRPAFASEDNSPEKPNGIILFERLVSPDFDPKKHKDGEEVDQYKEVNGIREYVSGWAKILCEMDEVYEESPPFKGIGYLELRADRIKDNNPEKEQIEEKVNILTNQLEEIRNKIQKMDKNNKNEKEYELMLHDARALQIEIDQINKYSISLVKVDTQNIKTFIPSSKEQVLQEYSSIVSDLTTNGMYGGVLLRVRSKDSVIKETCAEICSRYKGHNDKDPIVSTPDEDFNGFLRFGNGVKNYSVSNGRKNDGNRIIQLAIDSNLEIDLIPIQKINCGGVGKEEFNKVKRSGLKDNLNKARLTYENIFTGESVARFVVARTCFTKDKNNLILGEAHTISEAIGNPFLLNDKNEIGYKMYSARDKKEVAQPKAPEEKVNVDHSNNGLQP